MVTGVVFGWGAMIAMNATERFREADVLFKEGRFEEALAILQDLDKLYPGDRHLLYPMALSLAKLGRLREGLQICERLEAEFGYAKAADLARKLRRILTPPQGTAAEAPTTEETAGEESLERAVPSPPELGGDAASVRLADHEGDLWADTGTPEPSRELFEEADEEEDGEMRPMEERGEMGLLGE